MFIPQSPITNNSSPSSFQPFSISAFQHFSISAFTPYPPLTLPPPSRLIPLASLCSFFLEQKHPLAAKYLMPPARIAFHPQADTADLKKAKTKGGSLITSL
jgi:hypothetical protein